MLLPDRHNFTIWKGATFRTQLTLYLDQGVTLRPLTGYTGSLIIRDEPGGTPLLSLSEGNGITCGADPGVVEIYIDATTTAGLTWEIGHYDLLITAPGTPPTGGDTDALLWGTFAVKGV